MAVSRYQGNVRYDADYSGIGQMLTSGFMQADMLRRAEEAKAWAVARAGTEAIDSGKYAGSFEVESGVQTSANGTRRAYGELRNTDPKSFVVEFGSGPDRPQGGSSPAHRILLSSLMVMENADA